MVDTKLGPPAPYSHAVRTTRLRGHRAVTAHSPAALVRP